MSGRQTAAFACLTFLLAIAAFQGGRKSVRSQALTADGARTASLHVSRPATSLTQQVAEERNVTMRNVATVPFSQLYDLLRSATDEQIATWAADLENMSEGPKRTAAVRSFYKSLIQVNPAAAIKAILAAQNLAVRDEGIAALLKTAPESIWGDLAEMFLHLRKPVRVDSRTDVFWRWSMVDPAAASDFIERHPSEGEDDRLYSLLSNWGEIDAAAAKAWMEADVSRQTNDGVRAFVCGWAAADRSAAIDYAVANAGRANFNEAIKDLSYFLLPKRPDETRGLILRLPAEQAKLAVDEIVRRTTGVFIHAPEGYQRPPDEVARWMVTLPRTMWSDGIGRVVRGWMRVDAESATAWMNQLPQDARNTTIADVCRASDSEDAEKTVALGFTISDRTLRDEALGQLISGLGRDHEASLAALERLRLSHEQKAYLRRIMPRAQDEREE